MEKIPPKFAKHMEGVTLSNGIWSLSNSSAYFWTFCIVVSIGHTSPTCHSLIKATNRTKMVAAWIRCFDLIISSEHSNNSFFFPKIVVFSSSNIDLKMKITLNSIKSYVTLLLQSIIQLYTIL